MKTAIVAPFKGFVASGKLRRTVGFTVAGTLVAAGLVIGGPDSAYSVEDPTSAATSSERTLSGDEGSGDESGFEEFSSPEDAKVENVDEDSETEVGADIEPDGGPQSGTPQDSGIAGEDKVGDESAGAESGGSGFQVLSDEGEHQYMPSCEEGYFYSQRVTGQLQQIAPDGTVTNFGSPVPTSQGTSFNGLGIGPGGVAYGVSRTGSGSNRGATVWQFNTQTGKWEDTGETITNSRTNLIGGAVDPVSGKYYFGGFTSNRDMLIYEFDPAGPEGEKIKKKATVETAGTGSTNGDFAFDTVGNLYIVGSKGGATEAQIFSVTKENFAAASDGSTVTSAASAVVDLGPDMDNVTGMALDSSGRVFISSDSKSIWVYDMPDLCNGEKLVDGAAGLVASADLASCSSPPTIQLEKVVEGGRVDADDQFKLTLKRSKDEDTGCGEETTGKDTVIGEVTTEGSKTGVQDERVGPLLTLRNIELEISEQFVEGANKDDYETTYSCTLDGEPWIHGKGTEKTFKIPNNGNVVLCQFTNKPLIAKVNVSKEELDTNGKNPSPGEGWSMNVDPKAQGEGDVELQPDGDSENNGKTQKTDSENDWKTQKTASDGNASWRLRLDAYESKADVDISETQKEGWEYVSGKCTITHLDGSKTETDLPSEDPKTLENVKPGDEVDCTYTNKQKPGEVTWDKIDDTDDKTLLEGSEWTITGPGFPAEGEVIKDCVASGAEDCTGLDVNPELGRFTLKDLPWGEYTVTETKSPEYHSGDVTFTFTVDASNAGTTINQGEKVNPRDLGEVLWTKVDGDGAKLGGTEWTIDGEGLDEPIHITDCVAPTDNECTGLDKDPVEGQFLVKDLPWGDYTLVETKSPNGYLLDETPKKFEIGPENGLRAELDDIKNLKIPTPELPLTGGLSRVVVLLAGGGILALAAAAAINRHRGRLYAQY